MQPTAPQEVKLTQERHVDDDEIDLRSLFKRIWSHRKLIITGTLTFVVVALIVNESMAKYESYGFLKLNGLDPISQKRYHPIISDERRFQAYIQEKDLQQKDVTDSVAGLIGLPKDVMDKQITFVRALTPKDVKDHILVKDIRENSTSAFIGIETLIPGPTPELAQARNSLFLVYYVDSLAYTDLSTAIRTSIAARSAAIDQNSLKSLEVKRSIDDNQLRLAALRSMAKNIQIDSRFVLEIDKGAQKVLSPVAQMIQAESALVEARIALKKLTRDRHQIDMYHDYYKQAANFLSTTVSGHRLMEKLIALVDSTFPDKTSLDENKKEVAEFISIQLEETRKQYLDHETRYLSSPTLPEKKTKKSSLMVVLIAGGGGMLFMTFIALLTSWWREAKVEEPTLPTSDS